MAVVRGNVHSKHTRNTDSTHTRARAIRNEGASVCRNEIPVRVDWNLVVACNPCMHLHTRMPACHGHSRAVVGRTDGFGISSYAPWTEAGGLRADHERRVPLLPDSPKQVRIHELLLRLCNHLAPELLLSRHCLLLLLHVPLVHHVVLHHTSVAFRAANACGPRLTQRCSVVCDGRCCDDGVIPVRAAHARHLRAA